MEHPTESIIESSLEHPQQSLSLKVQLNIQHNFKSNITLLHCITKRKQYMKWMNQLLVQTMKVPLMKKIQLKKKKKKKKKKKNFFFFFFFFFFYFIFFYFFFFF